MAGEMDPDCRGSMRWDESTWDHALFRAMSGAIAMRRANPALRRGTLRVVGAEGGACAFVRADDAATFLVAVNAGDAELGLEVGLPEVAGRALAPIAWDGPATAGIRIPDDGRVRVTLPAREALVFRTEP